MPNTISCISKDLQKLIIVNLSSKTEERKLKKVPICDGDQLVGFGKARKRTGKKGGGPYQKFISDCMKGAGIKSFDDAPGAMGKCAVTWNENKESLTKKYSA